MTFPTVDEIRALFDDVEPPTFALVEDLEPPTLDEIRDLIAELEPPKRTAICHPDRLFDVEAELARLEADGVRHRITVRTSRWIELDQIVILDVDAAEKALAKGRHPSGRQPVDSPPRATSPLWRALGGGS